MNNDDNNSWPTQDQQQQQSQQPQQPQPYGQQPTHGTHVPYGAPPTPYGAPPPYGMPGHDTSVMTTGDWVKTLLILLIPCVGIIMYFVWAFGSGGNLNRRNYARAYLIMMAIGIALYFILFAIFMAAGFAMLEMFMWSW